MLRIFVDSGSSIKQNEKEILGVEVLPLKITLGDREYLDGIDLPVDIFYDALINGKLFPKTSLPSLGHAEDLINEYTESGDNVLIITISSGISGTFNALKTLFSDNPHVLVIDSKSAVGGVRILVHEANKYRDKSLEFIGEKLNALVPRLRVVAVPETLEYLCRGGRLSRSAFTVGSLLQLKPLISIDSQWDGSVKVLSKVVGKRRAMAAIAAYLTSERCDVNYPIVPSYTYDSNNLDMLISMTSKEYLPAMTSYDELDPAVACHWGPGAFGYIFVAGE
jgi:DegV family protein with EDD domain